MYEFLAAPLTAWFLAQLIKFTTASLRGDVNFSWFWRSGGMPSSHSSIVTGLALTIGFFAGFGSSLFAVSAIFAAIVIYDSLNVRRSVGENNQAINKLLQNTNLQTRVKVVLGHTGIEVIGGVLLGSIVAVSYAAGSGNVDGLVDFISTPLSGLEFRIAWLSVAIILVGAILYNSFAFKNKKTPTYKRLKKVITYSVILPTVFAALFVVLAQQKVTGFEWRMWVWGTLLLVVILQISYSVRFYSKLPLLTKEENKKYLNKSAPKRNSKKRKRK